MSAKALLPVISKLRLKKAYRQGYFLDKKMEQPFPQFSVSMCLDKHIPLGLELEKIPKQRLWPKQGSLKLMKDCFEYLQ